MIVLTETTDSIKIVFDGDPVFNDPQIISCYRDITVSDYTPKRSVVTSTGTTPINIVDAPAASTQRVVDFIHVYNGSSNPYLCTINFDNNGTLYKLFETTLKPYESLEYVEGTGFKVFDDNGNWKTSINQSNNAKTGVLKTVLGSDVSTTSSTIGDVTGLSFAVEANKSYWFRFVIQWEASATATGGTRWSMSGPAAPRELRFRSQYSLTTTTDSFNTLTAYDAPATLSATSALTNANIAVVEGIFLPSASGTAIARFASEGATITAKTGSVVFYQEI